MVVEQDMNSFFTKQWDVIVISTGHVEYKSNKKFLTQLLGLDKTFIFDTIGLFSNEEIKLLLAKHTVRVLGRGDIK
jgi:UDP-N-acetyl-D-mannosaminuronate dehydrogenase